MTFRGEPNPRHLGIQGGDLREDEETAKGMAVMGDYQNDLTVPDREHPLPHDTLQGGEKSCGWSGAHGRRDKPGNVVGAFLKQRETKKGEATGQ